MPRTRKSELVQALDDIAEVKTTLQNAYTVEATREELAEAVGNALDTLEGYDAAEEEEEGSESD